MEGGDDLPEGGEVKMTAGDVEEEQAEGAAVAAAPAEGESKADGEVAEVSDKVGKVDLSQ